MRHVAYVTLLAIPALLLVQCTAQVPARQAGVDATEPHIVVHILATSAVQAAQAAPTASATSTDRHAPTVSEATSMPLGPTATALPTITPLEPAELLPTATPVPIYTSTPEDAPADDIRAQLLGWHNQARAEAGLYAFRLSRMLQSAAQLQADYLAHRPATELMQLGPDGHRGPNDDTPAERAARCGYGGSRITENWAYFDGVRAAFEFWLTDSWHRPQVLSGDLFEVGFGVSTHPEFGLVVVAVYGNALAESFSSGFVETFL